MKKPEKIIPYTSILSVLMIFFLFGTTVFFSVNYFFSLKGISDLKEQNQNLNNFIDNMTKDKTDNKDSESTSNAIDQSEPEIKNVSVIFANNGGDFTKYIDSIKQYTSIPFYYIKDAELESDIILNYSVLYEDIKDNPAKDLFYYYNSATLDFVQQYGQLNVSFLSGMFGTGGTCKDQYYLDTKLEGNEVNVCVGADSTNFTVLGYPLTLSEKTKNYDSAVIKFYILNEGEPDKEDLEEMIKNLVRVN